jgi:hypothetical protein
MESFVDKLLNNHLLIGTLTIFLVSLVVYLALFHADKNNFNGMNTTLDVLYFTSTTHASVGYGDITPKSDIAKIIALMHHFFLIVWVVMNV